MHVKGAVASAHFPHRDAEIILAYMCGKPRTWIIAHGEYTLTPEEERRWNAYRKRRGQGEPVAYITGEKEFFGRPFFVNRSVLIPRPSTEGLVEMALKILSMVRGSAKASHLTMTHQLDTGIVGMGKIWGPLSDIHTIVDIGTGSGCIAITLACELPEIAVIATDTSASALTMARANAERHGVGERIRFLQGNLLEPLQTFQKPFLLVSNPPYIPEEEPLQPDVEEYEPTTALRAGTDGRAVLCPLIAQAHTHPSCRGLILECRSDQRKALRK